MKNYEKKIGKIYSYDDEVGEIITEDKIYNFSKKDLTNINKDDGILENNDFVKFYSNTYPFADEHLLVARDIEITDYKE